jgi:ATP-dependent exoDNAse (exonuclease V) beta subunit
MTRAEEHLVLSFTRSGKKLPHWAQDICQSLHLDLEQARDEVLTRTTPDGAEWKLRLVVAGDAVPDSGACGESRACPGQTRLAPRVLTPVEWIALPSVSEQQETNATVTAIAAFAKCPREYYLGHYLGFEGRPRNLEASGDLQAAEFGTMVHALLAGTSVPNADPRALALVEVARQSPVGRRLARATRVEREFDFLMAVEGLVLRGQIDLWFEEGGELVIVDYKTDSVTAVEAHLRAVDYTVQLRLYALAVERITGRHPDRAWLHFLRPNTLIEVDLTPSLLDAPEQIVHDFQHAQDRIEFPLREGEHCRRCPFFRDLCPAGGSGN